MGVWLRVLEIGLIFSASLGLSLILFPSPMQMAWNGLFFGQWAPPASFSPEAQAYIVFLYGVLGAVLVGFALALLGLARGALRRGERWAWNTITLSVSGWLVLDVGFSLWSGFWPNALLNLGFGVALLLPLWKLRPFAHKGVNFE